MCLKKCLETKMQMFKDVEILFFIEMHDKHTQIAEMAHSIFSKHMWFHLQFTTHLAAYYLSPHTQIIADTIPWERMQTRTPQLCCSHTLQSLHLRVCHLDL